MGIEQIIVIFVILLVSFLNWAFGEGGLRDTLRGKPLERTSPPDQHRARREKPISQSPPEDGDAERERLRRFFEALGVPAEEMPPEIQRESTPPPPPTQPELQTVAPRVEREALRPSQEPGTSSVSEAGASIRAAAQTTKTSAQAYLHKSHTQTSHADLTKVELDALEKIKASTTGFPVTSKKMRRARQPSVAESKRQLAALLASPQGLRDAFILRELLGPPKALQDQEQSPVPAFSR